MLQDSLLDLMLDNGELIAVIRGARVATGKVSSVFLFLFPCPISAHVTFVREEVCLEVRSTC
jgi:hypothetical protein